MTKLFYLVGQISPKYPETNIWRGWFEKEFEGSSISFINPCANQFNRELAEKSQYAINGKEATFGIGVLPSKDREFVNRSIGCIVNLQQYDLDKELLGSYFELAWYYDVPHKTVIGFHPDKHAYVCKHPFVSSTLDVLCESKEEAAHVLWRYFV